MKHIKNFNESVGDESIRDCFLEFIDQGFKVDINTTSYGYRVVLNKVEASDEDWFVIRIPNIKLDYKDLEFYIGDGINRCVEPNAWGYEVIDDYKHLIEMSVDSCIKTIYTINNHFKYGDITIKKESGSSYSKIEISVIVSNTILGRNSYASPTLCY